jgi:hypothetical protein
MSEHKPPAITPAQILEYAPKVKVRVLKIDANVPAYFGDMFYAIRKSFTSAPQKHDHKVPSGTGAAQSRS